MSDANKAITRCWVEEIWNGNDLSSAREYVRETDHLADWDALALMQQLGVAES